jgi:hypothetical protein
MDAVKDKVPSLAWLANKLDVTRGAVAQWQRVPAERIGEVSTITGIPPHVLRPDLFPTVSEPAQ